MKNVINDLKKINKNVIMLSRDNKIIAVLVDCYYRVVLDAVPNRIK